MGGLWGGAGNWLTTPAAPFSNASAYGGDASSANPVDTDYPAAAAISTAAIPATGGDDYGSSGGDFGGGMTQGVETLAAVVEISAVAAAAMAVVAATSVCARHWGPPPLPHGASPAACVLAGKG